ncbi:peptidase inhibitor family I36 protein [Lentzea sp. NPDC004782]|uniref:peptidase inhibitor family I36 protein n=1 Tax=Lentzea sp. NPDC004782 TaxID=3154458 RepID=UPI0033A6DD42
MKKLRILLLCLAALVTSVVVASPAQADDRCENARFCMWENPSFQGYKSYWWENDLQRNYQYDIRNWPQSRTTSSIMNSTAYYLHIWNAEGNHRCLPPGYNFWHVGSEYEDRITHLGLYTHWC